MLHTYTILIRFFLTGAMFTTVFDNIKFKDDFELELKRISNWSDDETLFDNIIYDYENRDVEKPFLAFVVTTQNHGGYD